MKCNYQLWYIIFIFIVVLQLMVQLLAYQLRQAGGTRGHLMVVSKLMLLCPPLLSRALPVLRFHLARHSWLPHAPRHALQTALRKKESAARAIATLASELMEVGLWIRLSALPLHQVSFCCCSFCTQQ
jgi:hypothetical protein